MCQTFPLFIASVYWQSFFTVFISFASQVQINWQKQQCHICWCPVTAISSITVVPSYWQWYFLFTQFFYPLEANPCVKSTCHTNFVCKQFFLLKQTERRKSFIIYGIATCKISCLVQGKEIDYSAGMWCESVYKGEKSHSTFQSAMDEKSSVTLHSFKSACSTGFFDFDIIFLLSYKPQGTWYHTCIRTWWEQ